MEPRVKKKSLFSMEEVLNSFSAGKDSNNSDNALKNATFNSLAFLVVFIAVLTGCGVYYTFQPFIKPLLWALLCGSALHPFKQLLALKLRNYITELETSSKSISLTVLFSPIICVLRVSDAVGVFVSKYFLKIYRAILVVLILSGVYIYTPNFVWRLCSFVVHFNGTLITYLLNIFSDVFFVIGVYLAFGLSLVLLWSQETKVFFSYTSSILWISLTAYLSNYFEGLRVFVFVFLQAALFGSHLFSSFFIEDKVEKQPDKEDENEEFQEFIQSDIEEESSFEESRQNGQLLSSSVCIRWLFAACACCVLINFPPVLYCLIILLLIHVVKESCYFFGMVEICQTYLDSSSKNFAEWWEVRKSVVFPPSVSCVHKLYLHAQGKTLSVLKSSCDSAAAIAVILGLLLCLVFGSLFLSLQAYKEGVYLVQTGSNIINQTIVNNPELQQILPAAWRPTVESILNNAYLYVRNFLVDVVRSLLKDRGIEEGRSLEIERSALELWDRAYQAWVMPTVSEANPETLTGPIVTPDAVLSSCYNFIERLKKTPEVASLDTLSVWARENMATLRTGLDSVWTILQGNMTLLLSILTTTTSVLFGGGLSIINFTLHSIIFLTALFYLLSSSKDMYKPVEFITQMSPRYGKRLAISVENACQEVLTASTKLSIFYGMWTWLIHNIFQSNLVYMPSVFAAILGVLPMLGTYWACLPAILDLWLVQGSGFLALGLFLAQLLPTAIVESLVYQEIQGGHPYLTGLSVAGGIFWLGIEGAIVGPLILCFLFVILNLAAHLNDDDYPHSSSSSL